METFVASRVTRANSWLDGKENVELGKVREEISQLAIDVADPGNRITMLDMFEGDSTAVQNFAEYVDGAAKWLRQMKKGDRIKIEPSVDLYSIGGAAVKGVKQITKSLKRLHPATFPKAIQKLMTDISKELGITEVLDIFGGIGNIGRMKEYGFKGKIKTNELEPRWGGQDTVKLSKERGVDEAIIGDSRNLDIPSGSVEAIMTSPTYGNLMALKAPSKKDSYQAFAGGRLGAGSTAGEVWGPKYEQLHREIYDEAFRVVKSGGYFVLNMKDKPVSAVDLKNNWIPKKGSTVEVRDQVMKATDWHVRALEDVGFKEINRYRVDEPGYTTDTGRFGRKFTVGYEDVVVMGKPDVVGVKLYDITQVPTEAAKTIIEGARKVSAYTRKARGTKAFKPKIAAKMAKESFVKNFVDKSGNIRKSLLDELSDAGYEVVQRMYLSKGASSLSASMLQQMRKEVYEGLTKAEKKILDDIILDDRMIDIGKYKTEKQFKHPKGLTLSNFVEHRGTFQFKSANELMDLTKQQADNLSRRAEAYFEWMRKPLKDMLEAELISEKEFEALSLHNYRRIKLVDIFDVRHKVKIGKRKRTVYDSGVEALQRGKETDIYEPSSEIMALEVFNRVYGRILNNKANQALLELARKDPTNSFVRVKENKGDKVPSGWSGSFVFEGGERKSIYLSPEMSSEWIVNNPELGYTTAKVIRFATLSPVLRTFATGINWGFALANLPRDIMHTWFAARKFENGKWSPIYNPTLPVYGVQMGIDLATVFSDAALRKGRYKDYIKEGGGMEFLVHQGRVFQRGRHLEGNMDKINNFFGYFGETSEILTRLAIRERMIKQGKSPQEATFVARDYMDFGQGGGVSKAFDNGIPYLNAAIQGTRGMFRAFKDNPLSSTYKLSQFAALTAGLYIAMNKMHPESFKALKGNIDMQNNLVITLGDDFGFEDGYGQMRYPYLKVPLDPSQKFFKTFFEGAADKWLGNEVDVNRIVDSLKEQSPVGVTELPPSISGVLGYVTNKDFWMNEDIWRKTEPLSFPQSQEEYIPGKTPQAYIDFGAVTGMSPERTRYVVEELTTSGTVWSYLLGQGYDAVRGLPKSNKEQHLAMTLSRIPVVKRFFGVTSPYSQFADPLEKAEEKDVVNRWIQNRGLDARVEGYLFDKNIKRKEVIDYMREFKDKKVFDRLKDRLVFQEKIKDLPNRSFWLRMKSLNVEARAEVYVNRLERATEKEKEQLMNELQKIIQIGGVVTKSFRNEVSKLQVR